jgi:predicted aspartyl protease
MLIKSLSPKRLIIEATINGKPAFMLIDTGASVSLVDIRAAARYGFTLRGAAAIALTGAGGALAARHVAAIDVRVKGIPLYQFIAADITAIMQSIARETGISVCGIIGLPQIKAAEMRMNPATGTIQLGY